MVGLGLGLAVGLKLEPSRDEGWGGGRRVFLDWAVVAAAVEDRAAAAAAAGCL